MDNKRLDEAVEVALSAESDALNGGNTNRYSMRAALLASLPVLLGEPVAWMYRFNHPLPNGGMCEWHTCDYAYTQTLPRVAYDVRPIYAPSLGEGE